MQLQLFKCVVLPALAVLPDGLVSRKGP